MSSVRYSGLESAGAAGIPSCEDGCRLHGAPEEHGTAKLRATKRVAVRDAETPAEEARPITASVSLGRNRPSCALCLNCRLCSVNPSMTCDLCRNCLRCQAYHTAIAGR